MFVDEITIQAKAGDGGNGVVRWLREKFKPKGGPAGGNGGRGGDVFVRAVSDLNRLAKYTGSKTFKAGRGEAGGNQSQYGKNGEDITIDIPVGSVVTNVERGRSIELTQVGQIEKILQGGRGGLGNEYFKSSTNRAPQETTDGVPGEEGTFTIELSLVVDVGLIGLPNAGKSTLLNQLTNAKSEVGAYQFTTLEPHLGALYEFTIADIPGLISGASTGKGLGHKFLRHISRTKMLLHLISLENEDVKNAYYTILKELSDFDKTIAEKDTWIILSKKDLVSQDIIDRALKDIDNTKNRVFVVSENDEESIKSLHDELVKYLRKGKESQG